MTELSIVIPVLNEEKTLEKVLAKIVEMQWENPIEVIIVDDGSTDMSRDIGRGFSEKHSNFKWIGLERNVGKSQAVKRGIVETSGAYVVIQDADLEYDVSELVQMLSLIKSQDFDVVYGNRFGVKNKVIYIYNYVGNMFISFLSNLFTYRRLKVYIPDVEVCYKMVKGNILREVGSKIASKSNFGFEVEVTARLSRYQINGRHLKFAIMPVHYNPRSYREGKKIKAFWDGFKAVYEIFRFNLFED